MTEVHPLFVYGSLRPGELAHRQIRHLVADAAPGQLDDFELAVRDGLPLIRPCDGAAVEGCLLWALAEQSSELLRITDKYEGDALYERRSVTVVSSQGRLRATAYVGKKLDVGRPVRINARAWSSADDPLFGPALDAIRRLMSRHLRRVRPMPGDVEGFWDAFLPLQGTYLTLCTVLERYTMCVFGASVGPTAGVRRLGHDVDALAAVREADPPEVSIVDTRTASAPQSTAESTFDAWYGVRCNLSHRGKAAFHDFELVERSIVGLHDTLRLLLAKQLPLVRSAVVREPEELLLKPVYVKYRSERGAAAERPSNAESPTSHP